MNDRINLSVAAMDGASFRVSVPSNGTISDVKRALHEANAEIAIAAVCLFVAGTEAALPDVGRLRDLGVSDATTLFALMHAPPHLDSQTTVCFAPFARELKSSIVKRVIAAATGLPGLRENYSAEGGFELPLTADWLRAIRTQDPHGGARFLKYHGSRQFRFTSATASPELIGGLYTKDATRWWTTAEKE